MSRLSTIPALLIARPWQVIALALIVVACALSGLVELDPLRLRLAVDPSIRTLLPDSGTAVSRFESVRERYSSDDLLLVAWVDDALFTPARLARLKALTRQVEQLPGVIDVESPATATQVVVFEDYSEVRGYLSELPQTLADAERVRAQITSDPLYSGYLVSHDGRGAMLAVRFDPGLSSRTLIERVAQIGELSAAAAEDVEQFLSGPLYVRLEISRLLLRDLFRVMPLAITMTLLVVALGFRHLRGVVLPFAANAVALVVTLALFALAGHTLNYVLVILPPTIYVVGFAYAIHVISDFDRELAARRDRRAAVAAALAEVAAPLGLTALTTAIGFLSLSLSSIDAIRIFGQFAALGTVCACIAALTVVPAGLVLMPASPRTAPVQRNARSSAWLARVATTHGHRLLVLGALLGALSVLGASRIEVSTDYLNNFGQDSAIRKNFERMSSVFSGAVPLQVVLEADAPDVFKQPAALYSVLEIKNWLLAQPEIGGVYSLLDYIGVLERALAPELIDDDPVPESAGLTSHLILLGGTEDVYRFAEPGFNSSLLQVRARAVASADLNALTARIEARLAELPAGLTGYVTGSSHVVANTLDAVTRGQVLSLAAALIPIGAILVVLFRSLRLGLLALIPNALPIVVFFGVLGFSGVTLNLTTSLVAAVVLGIAVDDSIHFFARLRAYSRRTRDRQVALEQTLAAILRPVSFTSAGLALGFMTLVAGELLSQIEFGVLAALTLAVAWLLDLTLTPALAWRYGIADARSRDDDDAAEARD